MDQHKIIFWGTPSFALPSLRALHDTGRIVAVVTQPDKRKGRGRKEVNAEPVKAYAEKEGIPLLQPDTLDENFIDELKKYLPATFLVVAYGKIIPDDVLLHSELPAVNVHPSLLPELRGPSPIQTALLKGLHQTGVTLMQLDSEVDHGPIIGQKKIAISPEDTYETLSEKLSHASAQFVVKYISRYTTGKAKSVPQDHTRATHTKMIKSKDGELDLSETPVEIVNTVRALNPWPGTFISLGSKRLKILSAAVHNGPELRKKFGRSDSGSIIIRCTQGAFSADRVQLEGKKPMHSLDFLNGYSQLLGL